LVTRSAAETRFAARDFARLGGFPSTFGEFSGTLRRFPGTVGDFAWIFAFRHAPEIFEISEPLPGEFFF
jgi:hypothetical protein